MKTALITGASAGIGFELAKLFVRDGHSVVLVARRKDKLESITQELKALNPQVTAQILTVDLSRPDGPQEVFRFTAKHHLHIDFLVNNAGFGSFGPFVGLDEAKELEMIDLNVRSLVALTHFYLKDMIKAGAGRILNVGSTAGFQPGPFMTTYYATKAFVNSFSEGLNFELKGTGVTCTVLAPGPTLTEFQAVAKIEKNKLVRFMKPAAAAPVAEAGYKAMHQGQALCIPGATNKFLVQTLRVTPRALVRKITATLNKP